MLMVEMSQFGQMLNALQKKGRSSQHTEDLKPHQAGHHTAFPSITLPFFPKKSQGHGTQMQWQPLSCKAQVFWGEGSANGCCSLSPVSLLV